MLTRPATACSPALQWNIGVFRSAGQPWRQGEGAADRTGQRRCRSLAGANHGCAAAPRRNPVLGPAGVIPRLTLPAEADSASGWATVGTREMSLTNKARTTSTAVVTTVSNQSIRRWRRRRFGAGPRPWCLRPANPSPARASPFCQGKRRIPGERRPYCYAPAQQIQLAAGPASIRGPELGRWPSAR